MTDTQSQVCKIKMQEQIFLGVSVISVQVRAEVSQSYQGQRWSSCLTHISFSSKPRVSLISVSFGPRFGSFCRSHIWHPLYMTYVTNGMARYGECFGLEHDYSGYVLRCPSHKRWNVVEHEHIMTKNRGQKLRKFGVCVSPVFY